MNMKSIRQLAAGLLFASLSASALAQYTAIAFAENNAYGWANKDSQQAANKAALAACAKYAQGATCKLDSTVAIARAQGAETFGYGRSSKSVADAKRVALESCGKPDCKIAWTETDPGFYALARTKEADDGSNRFHFQYREHSSDQVDKIALERCANQAGRECKIIWSGSIAGNVDAAVAASNKSKAVNSQSCRPNTPTVRCSSQCVNGNCTVTYENGCKLNVQVQPVFDPLSNQWKYPAPTC